MCFVFALNLCSRSQAASSNAAGEGRLQALQELQAAHGRGRLEAELESMSGAVLRQVNKAANLPVRTHEGRIPVAELRSALLAHLLSASDDQEQAGHVGIGVCSDRILLEYLLIL